MYPFTIQRIPLKKFKLLFVFFVVVVFFCFCFFFSKSFYLLGFPALHSYMSQYMHILLTVKILKIGTPEIITIIVLQLERLDFTVQYCVQKMQTE